MNVSLTPELDDYVHSKVKSGLYTSASEVVREALRHMQVEDARREGNSHPAVQGSRPNYLRIVAEAEASPNRFKTREEVDEYLNALRSEW